MKNLTLVMIMAAICATQGCGSPNEKAPGATDTVQTDVSGVNTGNGSPEPGGDDSRSSGETAPGDLTHKSGADDDSAYFMKEAGAGGLMEVELGKVAMKKAVDPAVKDFAKQMVTDHTKANAELNAIAKKAGIIMPSELLPAQREHLSSLNKLSGNAFDKQYMSMMVSDHQKTLALFKSGQNVNKDDLVDFAKRTHEIIESHYNHAKSINSNLQ